MIIRRGTKLAIRWTQAAATEPKTSLVRSHGHCTRCHSSGGNHWHGRGLTVPHISSAPHQFQSTIWTLYCVDELSARRSIMVMANYIYLRVSSGSPRLSCLFALAVFWVQHQYATGKAWLDSSLPTYPLYLISGVPSSQEETAKLATQSSVWSANWSCKIYPSRVPMENLRSLEEEIRWIHMLLLWYLIISSSDFVL